MAELIRANTSKGTLIVTENNVIIRLAGNERSIARGAISEVRIGLGMFVFVGFLRVLTLTVVGERRSIVLANMKKAKALQVKSILGF